jgi:TonB family protein
MRRFLAVLIATWAFIAATVDARAETAAAAIIPPRLIEAPDVPYPAGALGNAVVELAITVDKDGSVLEVQVMTGLEPFSTRAAEIARQFRFAPAERDGKPVAAKIRFEIRFS